MATEPPIATDSPARPLAQAREFCAGVVAARWPGSAIAAIDAMRGDASTRSYARVRLDRVAPEAPATLVVMMMQDAAVAMSSEELGVFGKDGPRELAFVNVGRYLASLTPAVTVIHARSEERRVGKECRL